MKINKKGFTSQIIVLFILFIVLIIILLGYYAYSMLGAPVFTVSNDIINDLQSSFAQGSDKNLSTAVNVGTNIVAQTLNILKWFGWISFLLMIFAFLVVAYHVRTYPFLIFIWIFFIIVLAFVAMILSNNYQDMASDGSLGYSSFTMDYYYMNYLPHIIIAVGLVSGVILFALSRRERFEEATLE
jgi:hypothetical protein